MCCQRRTLALARATVPLALALIQVIERSEWLYRKPSDASSTECPGSAFGTTSVRDIFYLPQATWQAKVVKRGTRLAEQAIKALAMEPSSVPAPE